MFQAVDEIEKAIEVLISQLKKHKTDIDNQNHTLQMLYTSLDIFEGQYRVYILELEEKRDRLRHQLNDCQQTLYSILNNENDNDISVVEEEPSSDVASAGEPFNPAFLEDDNQQPIEGEFPSSLPDDMHIAKKSLHIYFAKYWHPDRLISESEPNHLMRDLNVVFNESQDVVDMLVKLPWDDAWIMRNESESLGEQWERLMTWIQWLKEAHTRLERELASVQHNWHFANYQAWEDSGRSTQFFADLGNQLRHEIIELQQEVDMCQEELQETNT